MRRAILAFVLAFSSALAPARAQFTDDKLFIVSAETDVGAELRQHAIAFTPDVRVRVLVEGTHIWNDARGVKLRQGQYYIFYDSLMELLPPDNMTRRIAPQDVTCEAPVPAELGRRLETVWNAALAEARQEDIDHQRIVVTPFVSHTFTSLTGARPASGWTDNLATGVRIGALKKVSNLLRTACEDQSQLPALDDAVGQLAQVLR
jgi:hypothetical protein